MKKRHAIKVFILLLGDFLLLWTALALSLLVRYFGTVTLGRVLILQHLIPFSFIFILWIIIFGAFGLYDLRITKNSKRFLYRLLRAISANTILAIIIFYLLPFFTIEPRRNLFLIAFFATGFIFLWRYLFNHLIVHTATPRVLFFGVTSEALELADYLLKNPQLGQRPVALMSANGENIISSLSILHVPFSYGLKRIVKEQGIETIVINREIKENKFLVSMLFQVIPLGVSIVEFTMFHEMFTGKIPLSLIGEVWFLENLIGMKRGLYEFFKRGFDILLAGILILPAALLFPVIALAIKINAPGSVFFRQKRIGKNGKIFELLKYRSTFRASVAEHEGWEKEERAVYTKTGVFLRKTYLDELPQIINIVKGEMSFIGPRPERPEFVEELKKNIPFYEMRLLTPPGLTGWAQINMENDAAAADAPEKMQYDLYYIKNRTFVLDLLIALRTIATLVHREGR